MNSEPSKCCGSIERAPLFDAPQVLRSVQLLGLSTQESSELLEKRKCVSKALPKVQDVQTSRVRSLRRSASRATTDCYTPRRYPNQLRVLRGSPLSVPDRVSLVAAATALGDADADRLRGLGDEELAQRVVDLAPVVDDRANRAIHPAVMLAKNFLRAATEEAEPTTRGEEHQRQLCQRCKKLGRSCIEEAEGADLGLDQLEEVDALDEAY